MTTLDMNLSHHFLIAMPDMVDPFFTGSVTYLLKHDENGAMGVIINLPLGIRLGDIFTSSVLESFCEEAKGHLVYQGGPVAEDQGFVLHEPTQHQWHHSMCNDHLCLTTSRDILEAISKNEGPKHFLFCLGYCRWSENQLEDELKQNAWLTVKAEPDVIFNVDESEKYAKALAKLGIDLSSLSGHGGIA